MGDYAEKIIGLVIAIIIGVVIFPAIFDGLKMSNSTSVFSPEMFNSVQNLLWVLPIIVVAGVLISVVSYSLQGREVDYVPTQPREIWTTEEPYDEVEEPKTIVFEYKCPRCSASINFDYGETRTKCEYCGSRLHRREELADED